MHVEAQGVIKNKTWHHKWAEQSLTIQNFKIHFFNKKINMWQHLIHVTIYHYTKNELIRYTNQCIQDLCLLTYIVIAKEIIGLEEMETRTLLIYWNSQHSKDAISSLFVLYFWCKQHWRLRGFLCAYRFQWKFMNSGMNETVSVSSKNGVVRIQGLEK